MSEVITDLETLHKTFEGIGDIAGLKAREDALRNLFLNNPNIQEIVRRTLDPFVNFGITSKSYVSFEGTASTECVVGRCEPNGVEELLNLLVHLECSGDLRTDKLVQVHKFINFYGRNLDVKKMILGLIDKDLDIGVGISTYNSCVPKENKIPSGACMFCKPTDYLTPFLSKLKNVPAIISPKLDGHRALFHIKFNGGNAQLVSVISRNGKPYNNYDEMGDKLCKVIQNISKSGFFSGTEIVIDGEILNPKSFEATMKQARRKYNVDLSGIKFSAFDIFEPKSLKVPLWERLLFLGRVIDTFNLMFAGDTTIELCPFTELHSPTIEDCWKIHDEYVENGFEGAVIKRSDSFYQFKKSTDWVKIKKFDTLDLTVIGLQEHTKNSGTLGSLICDFEGKELHVGSGFSDSDRQEFFKNNVIGRTIEVQYQSRSKNTLQFPVFRCFREDKD